MNDGERMFRQRAKALMRRRFRGQRASIPTSAVAARSAALCARLLEAPEMASATGVALFWPIERFKEVDLRSVDASLRARDRRVAYPEIDPETRVMTFRFVDDPLSLSPCELGFFAPPASAAVATQLDVVVVPGIAFDPQGYRIGYGAGFYDQSLPTVCPPAIAIGVAFDFQLAADIPFAEHDVPVDVIITDRRRLDVKA